MKKLILLFSILALVLASPGFLLAQGSKDLIVALGGDVEGWDPATGYPIRSTLKALKLEHVADELEKKGKLGNG